MFRGFATIVFWADELEAAKDWYSRVLEMKPYFSRPGPDGNTAYYEFRVGDYENEFGLIDGRYRPSSTEPGGAIMYWHVDDLEGTFERLLSLGAKEHQPITAQGDTGFVTASVVDPFGNVLGIMTNPHYLEILETLRPSSEN
ncbi:VOC family protein [Actinomadura spongiicola]|uniref:VOC family protein n=1 Tax=Actinomadura spongiicola TaxID=2303421 RepID=A0A372G997_9ACTN|nr:VOC family protein [Actinomadura spongiicola]RFS81941.1 VOC family protein [Actinomadura spongiicola]